MKNVTILSAILLFANCCSKDKKDDSLTQDLLFQMIVSIPWEIDLFTKGDEIVTSDFSGYSFTFTVGNVIIASNGTNEYLGSWYAINDNNPDSESGLTFHTVFTEPEAFAALTRDWAVISATQQMIRLQFVNEPGEPTDYLTFGDK